MEHIDQVLKAAQRAAELIQQVLTFSRETGDQKKPFRIYLIVKETMKLLRSSFPAYIEMENRLESRQMVVADLLNHQMIMSLCLNAISHEDNGGVLTVSLTDETITRPEQIRGREIPAGEYLKLSVTDTGQNVDDQMLDQLFNPESGTRKGENRISLDLATVRSIVDEHEGMMDIHSRPNKGTTIDIFFPVAAAKKKSASETSASAESVKAVQTGGETIMLVDDEQRSARL